MKTGTFRRQVIKTLTVKATKTGLRTTSRNTVRTLSAQSTVALKGHTGQLLQAMGQYLLGLQQTQEMKDAAFHAMGDIAYDVAVLCRVLKVKMPSSTKKSKLIGTRAAALLHFDALTTDLLRQVEQGVFASPKMTKVTKTVTIPTDGSKEEREVNVVDAEADATAEAERQNEMRSYLHGVLDVYWRLSFDLFGKPPAEVLAAKFVRMQAEFPGTEWAEDTPKAKAKAQAKAPVKVVKPPVKAKAKTSAAATA